MFVDFGLAERRGGKCYLRFDDTNPEAESQEYIDHIKEIVSWMGWRYCAVTHSSDYFDQLHAFAVKLIKDGNAYVCHQSGDEIKTAREAGGMSPWRDRPAAESLRLFEDMRRRAAPLLPAGRLRPGVLSCCTPICGNYAASCNMIVFLVMHLAQWCPPVMWTCYSTKHLHVPPDVQGCL
jgi:tRNA synthetases class I (E and Q), catalytic domain